MAWADLHPYQPEINADLAALTPLHDFVLVQAFPPASPIINPGVHMTQDYRWRSDRPRGNRYGTVIAVGRGDRMFWKFCERCVEDRDVPGEVSLRAILATAKDNGCAHCGGPLAYAVEPGGKKAETRAEMHVKPGDVVIYPRVPANEIVLNGQEYTFLHEEQHILAVVEKED